MTWFDYAAAAVLAVSLLIGIWRGFAREAFALGGWIAAFAAAMLFAREAGALLPAAWGTPFARSVGAGVVIFLAVLIASGFAGMLLARVLRAAGLGLADRTFGGVFGFARGTLICLIGVLLGGLTSLPREPFWRQAALSGPLETMVVAAKPYLPAELAARVRYDR
jgi:membrane protein required for colicin V production